MDDIRILIADDDDGMRLIMRRFVEKAGGFQIVGEAKDGRELIRLNEQTHPQVILLDVEMPVMTGVECARIIQDINPKTILVFATAHEKYMGDAFEVYAFDYLLKPFREQRVMKTLALIRSRLAEEAEERAVKPETPRNVERFPVRAGRASARRYVFPHAQIVCGWASPYRFDHALWPLDVCSQAARHDARRAGDRGAAGDFAKDVRIALETQ